MKVWKNTEKPLFGGNWLMAYVQNLFIQLGFSNLVIIKVTGNLH